jgi:hypothetical protein
MNRLFIRSSIVVFLTFASPSSATMAASGAVTERPLIEAPDRGEVRVWRSIPSDTASVEEISTFAIKIDKQNGGSPDFGSALRRYRLEPKYLLTDICTKTKCCTSARESRTSTSALSKATRRLGGSSLFPETRGYRCATQERRRFRCSSPLTPPASIVTCAVNRFQRANIQPQ